MNLVDLIIVKAWCIRVY